MILVYSMISFILNLKTLKLVKIFKDIKQKRAMKGQERFFLDFNRLFTVFLKYSFLEQSFLNLNQSKSWNLVQSLGRYAQFNEQKRS